jgi:hypothetical protein
MARRASFSAWVERTYPYVVGLMSGLAVALWPSAICGIMQTGIIDGTEVASVLFNVLLTLTGLLFTVYVLAIAPGGGFIEKVFRTKTFLMFRRYVLEALVAGSVAMLAITPFIVSVVYADIGLIVYIVAISLVLSALLCFVRVVHVFMIWVAADTRLKQRR